MGVSTRERRTVGGRRLRRRGKRDGGNSRSGSIAGSNKKTGFAMFFTC